MAVGDFPTWPHEKTQIDQLVSELHAAFHNAPDRVELVVNVNVDGEQVDGLIYKNGGLVALEMKSWDGKISANFRGRNWTIHSDLADRKVESPIEQVERKRQAVGRAVVSLTAKAVPAGVGPVPRISGWVVVGVGAKPTLTGVDAADHWFDVLAVADVALALRTEGLPSVLSDADFDRFVEKIGARRCDRKEWLHRMGHPEASIFFEGHDSDQIRVPKIDSWLSGADVSLVARALDLIGELELRAYRTDVMEMASRPTPAIQRKALDLMIAWRLPGFRERVAEGVESPDEAIRRPILELAAREPIPEAVTGLGRVAHRGTAPDVRLAIQGLALVGGEAAKKPLLRLLGRRVQMGSDPELFPLETLVWAVGKVRIREAVSTLLDMLEWKEFRGFRDGDVPNESFRETVLISLGMIGGPDARRVILAELRTKKDDPCFALEAAAALADAGLADTVLPYLTSQDEAVRALAIRALGRSRNPATFDPIFHLWRQGLGEVRGRLDSELEEALIAIDPRRLERELPGLIDGHIGHEHLYRIWRIWDRVLSSESRESLLRFLEREELALDASSLLVRIANEGVTNRARQLLSEKSAKVRAGALWLLVLAIDPGEIGGILEDLAQDESSDVRVAVVGGYSRLPEHEVEERMLAFAVDRSEDVRGYCMAILGRYSLISQFHAQWVSSDAQRGTGCVMLLPKALVLEAGGPAAVIPLETVSRVGSCATLGPGGTLWVGFKSDGHTVSSAICLEKDPLDRRPSPALDSWFEAVVRAVKARRGRRVDLGSRGLSPPEGSQARELVATLPSEPAG